MSRTKIKVNPKRIKQNLTEDDKQYVQGDGGTPLSGNQRITHGTTASWKKRQGGEGAFKEHEFLEFDSYFPENDDGLPRQRSMFIPQGETEPVKGEASVETFDFSDVDIKTRTNAETAESRASSTSDNGGIKALTVNLSGRLNSDLENKIVGLHIPVETDDGDTKIQKVIFIPLNSYYHFVLDFKRGIDAILKVGDSSAQGMTHAMVTVSDFYELIDFEFSNERSKGYGTLASIMATGKTGSVKTLLLALEQGPFYDPSTMDMAFDNFFRNARAESADPIKMILDIEFGYISSYPDWLGGAGGDENTKEAFWRFMFYNNSFIDFNFTMRLPGPEGASLKLGSSDTHPDSFDWNPLDDSDVKDNLWDDGILKQKYGGAHKRVNDAINHLYSNQPDGFFRGAITGGKKGFGLVGPDEKTTEDMSKPVAVIKGDSGGSNITPMDEEAVQLYLTKSKHGTQGTKLNLLQGWIVFAGAAYVSDRILGINDIEADEMLDTGKEHIRQAGFLIGNLLANYIDHVNKKTWGGEDGINILFVPGRVTLKQGGDDEDLPVIAKKGFTQAVYGGLNGHSFYPRKPNFETAANNSWATKYSGGAIDPDSGYNGFINVVEKIMSQEIKDDVGTSMSDETKYELIASAFSVDVNQVVYVHYSIESRKKKSKVRGSLKKRLKGQFKKDKTDIGKRFRALSGGGLNESLERLKKVVVIRKIL